MIDHTRKCIYIHIPRTAGTSIERWITGKDWWLVDSKTKHLLASQARRIYADHWDAYFKFAFVRNPWDRMVSMAKYGEFYGVHMCNNIVNIDQYLNKYNDQLTLEHDQRFYRRACLLSDKHKAGCVYGNILDEELDFVGTYENLQHDITLVRDALGIKSAFDFHVEKSHNRRDDYTQHYNSHAKQQVESLYQQDIIKYNYNF